MASLTPYVPQTVVVHLGSPSSNAQNVTVDFIDYIKNVALSHLARGGSPSKYLRYRYIHVEQNIYGMVQKSGV